MILQQRRKDSLKGELHNLIRNGKAPDIDLPMKEKAINNE